MNEYKEVGSEGHISGLEVYTPTPIAGRSYGTPRSHPEDHQVDLTNSTISEDMHTERTPARRNKEVPYGLSPIAFAALVALATAIIVGAAIGGGLGGSLSHLQSENKALKQSPSSASVPTCTSSPQNTASQSTVSSTTAPSASASATAIANYNVTPPSSISSVALDCPALDGESYRTVRGQTYTFDCGVGLTSDDVGSILAYTIEDCIEACSSVNHFYSGTGGASLCIAVVFNAQIDGLYAAQHANCWLKNGTVTTGSNEQNVISARLTTG